MRARSAALVFALAALLGAAPASAEIYRWTDAQGREHFTMDLHRVPSEHRAEAERRNALDDARVDPGPDPINTMTTPDHVKVKRHLRRSRGGYGRPPAAASGASCSATHRNEARKHAAAVSRWEKQIELQEQLESRLVRTEDRLRAENRAERYRVSLELAEQARDDFEDRMRRQGVAPGCYR